MRTEKHVLLAGSLMLIVACQPSEPPAPEAIALNDPALDNVRDWASASSEPAGTPAPGTATSQDVPPVAEMIAGLEARLGNAPEDVKGWTLLAQSYAFVGRMAEAADAVDRAVALGADRTRLEAQVVKAHGEVR